MFDIWRRIEEKGAVSVLTKASALSALEWVEVGEKYPELIPAEFRQYDVYSDPRLGYDSPFVEIEKNDCRSFHFRATDPRTGHGLDVSIDVEGLIKSLRQDYFHQDDEESSFGAVLVCSCGIAGCEGLWSQTCHVSSKMVHWSVVHYEDKLELFFEREAYEDGAFEMLETLAKNPGKYSMTYDSLYERSHETFVEAVEDLKRVNGRS